MTDKAAELLRGLAEQLQPGNLTGVVMYLSVLTVGELDDLRSSLAALEEKERDLEQMVGQWNALQDIIQHMREEHATLKTALQAAEKALKRLYNMAQGSDDVTGMTASVAASVIMDECDGALTLIEKAGVDCG